MLVPYNGRTRLRIPVQKPLSPVVAEKRWMRGLKDPWSAGREHLRRWRQQAATGWFA